MVCAGPLIASMFANKSEEIDETALILEPGKNYRLEVEEGDQKYYSLPPSYDKGDNVMMPVAQSLYEAYCNHTGWKSLVSGADLPQWSDLKQEIKDAWSAAANAVPFQTIGSFGWALDALQRGEKVCRKGWNGRGMWLTYSPGHVDLPADRFFSQHGREYAESNGGSATVCPSVMIKNANGTISYWQPSSGDMFNNDWGIAE